MAKRKKTDPDTPGPPDGAVTGTCRSDGDGPERRRPVISFRCGTDRTTAVDVSVWENEITPEGGEPFKQYVTTAQRSYRNGDGEWKNNHSYRAHDLPVLTHLLMRAHAFITDRQVTEDIPF